MVLLIAPQSSFHERTEVQFRRVMKSRQIWQAPFCNNLQNNHLPMSNRTLELVAVELHACPKPRILAARRLLPMKRRNRERQPAGWLAMGLHTSESGDARPGAKAQLYVRLLFAIILRWNFNAKRLTGNRCGRVWRCFSPQHCCGAPGQSGKQLDPSPCLCKALRRTNANWSWLEASSKSCPPDSLGTKPTTRIGWIKRSNRTTASS